MLWVWRLECGDVDKGVEKWVKSRDLLVGESVEKLVGKWGVLEGEKGG